MGRKGLLAVIGVGLLAACSGGGGGSVAATTTSSRASTTTTQATTTTTTVEDAIRVAWDRYWAMVVRLAATPDGNDAELSQRAVDPLLSALRDDFATQKSKGQRVVVSAGSQYAHRLDKVAVNDGEATLTGCKIDDSTTVGPAGEVIDDSVSTSMITADFVLDGASWKAREVTFSGMTAGITGCASR